MKKGGTRALVIAVFCFAIAFVLFSVALGSSSLFKEKVDYSKGYFSISQLVKGEWKEIAKEQFTNVYATKEISLKKASEIILKISTSNIEFADIEKIKLIFCGKALAPDYAVYLDSNKSILNSINEIDNNVAIAHKKEIEISWTLAKKTCWKKPVLSLTANQYKTAPPLEFEGKYYFNTTSNEPAYSPFWTPTTGHPDGYTYIYISNSSENLYFDIDVTPDNTDEFGEDWTDLEINGKTFRIDDYKDEWGQCNFQNTPSADYAHQFCNFIIPFSEINQEKKSNPLNFLLRYYGTAGGYSTCPNTTGVWTVNSQYYPLNASATCITVLIMNSSNLTIQSNVGLNVSINITATNISLEEGSTINGTGEGWIGGTRNKNGFGSGAGINGGITVNSGGGGSYGGYGGRGSGNIFALAGEVYGSGFYPFEPGSGGGNLQNGVISAGGGGSALVLNATDFILLNGVVEMGGANGSSDGSCGAGAGSGGAIFITTANFSGFGNLSAIGGNSNISEGADGGAGGGGRIAVYYNTSEFTGTLNLSGGKGNITINAEGMPGTALFVDIDNSTVYIKDNFRIQKGDMNYFNLYDTINLTNTTVVLNESGISFLLPNFYMVGSKLNTISGNTSNTSVIRYNHILNFSVSNFTLDKNSEINLNYSGYAGGGNNQNGTGPGKGIVYISAAAGGGGYGGVGGKMAGVIVAKGGGPVGYLLSPLELGSGGAGIAVANVFPSGGSGGGTLLIDATENVDISGIIFANGENGLTNANYGAGGGSGGGVYITKFSAGGVLNFSGTGKIFANGGNGGAGDGSHEGGGGSGGRIVINYSTSTFTGSLNATGGNTPAGAIDGWNGSIVLIDFDNKIYQIDSLSVLTANDTLDNATMIIMNWQYVCLNVTTYSFNATYLNLSNNFFNGTGNILNLEYNVSFIDDNSSYENVNLRLARTGIARVQWNANASAVNLSQHTNLTLNRTYINSTMLPDLNTSVNITMYGLLKFENPQIKIDIGDTGDYIVCNETSAKRKCSNFSFDLANGIAVFNATGFTSYVIYKNDTTAPNISISYPVATTYKTSISGLNYVVREGIALHSCWYSNDGGETNTTIICGVNVTALGVSANGTYSWNIYANDSSGNVNLSSVTFIIYTAPAMAGQEVGSGPSSSGSSSTGSTAAAEFAEQIEKICVPDWSCSGWSACENGISTRSCSDAKSCGTETSPEESMDCRCNPSIKCSEWSACKYVDEIADIITGKISVLGYREKACSDSKKCVDSYAEREACITSKTIKTSEENIFGEETLVLREGENPVARINLEALREGRLEISFVQSNQTYPDSCFDGMQNGNETQIDCGGSCKRCKTEIIWINYAKSWQLWVLIILLVLLGIYARKEIKERMLKKHLHNLYHLQHLSAGHHHG